VSPRPPSFVTIPEFERLAGPGKNETKASDWMDEFKSLVRREHSALGRPII